MLEPDFLTRALSYSHTHFLMLLKLLNPLTPHLCFDYGYYCLPIISTVWTGANILSLLTYSFVLYWLSDALLLARRSSLLAFFLFLLPLVPALNILFPVGTTLAERLLFIPSMGIAMYLGEYFYNNLQYIWKPIGDHWVKIAVKYQYVKPGLERRNASVMSKVVMYTTLLPILGIMSYRVFHRNTEWKDEISIYSSALEVCPNNYKALTNTGMLLMNKNRTTNSVEAAALSDRALMIHDQHATAMLNSALAHAASMKFIKSQYRFKQAERLNTTTDFKLLYQYMGSTLNDYIERVKKRSGRGPTSTFLPTMTNGSSYSEADVLDAWWRAIDLLQEHAGFLLDYSISLGMDKPRVLFSRASTSIMMNTPEEYEKAVELLKKALEKNSELQKLMKQGVPVEDMISLENAHNQLGLALLSLERFEEAEENFLLAIEHKPELWESYINLGSLYFGVNNPQRAKEVVTLGKKMYQQNKKGPVHLSFMIQLGYAEELLGNLEGAYEFYNQGIQLVEEFAREGYDFDLNHVNRLHDSRNKVLNRMRELGQ